MASQREKLLLVDGYNVLRSGSRYKNMSAPDYTSDTFNTAREALLRDVANFAGREWKPIIVFDGGKNAFSTGETELIGNVCVMFSQSGSSADKVIEKLAHDARERNVEVLVVTSDAGIQDAAFGLGVDRMSANGFSREAAAYDKEARLDLRPQVAHKNTIASRIDAETLEKLKKLRDS